MKEIEIIQYEAFDGTVFDDRDTCASYEKTIINDHFYGFKCYGAKRERLTFEKYPDDILDWTCFIEVNETNNFIGFLASYEDETGLNCCYDDYGISNFTPGHYYYDEDNDRFIKIEDEIVKWQNELKNFPND